MAFGVTKEGFKPKRFADIIAEVGQNLKTQLDIDIDSDPDSIAKVITNIYSLSQVEGWAATEALQSMFDIDKAEGKHLDDLVGYQVISRLKAAASSGAEYITSSQEVVVPTNTLFKDANGNSYQSGGSIPVGLSSCVNATLDFNQAALHSILTVAVNSVTTVVTVTSTVENAVGLLTTLLNTNNTGVITAVNTSAGTNYSIEISNVSDLAGVNIGIGSPITLTSVTSFGTISKDINGVYPVLANTVTTVPAIVGITSVTNRYDFTTGRLQETDIELRSRFKSIIGKIGNSTVEAIRADLLGVTGVTFVKVIENNTEATGAGGIPPKSIVVTIQGGDVQDIANALWLTKGGGIRTVGNVSVKVIDSQGEEQYLNFSRPTPRYIHMHVNYSIYDEQSHLFPVTGETDMANILVSYGNSLGSGIDVIPQRFASQVIQNVLGLATVDITMGVTPTEVGPTPPLSPAIIPFTDTEEARFDAVRITFAEV